jgi:protein-tyrosine-phosphatase
MPLTLSRSRSHDVVGGADVVVTMGCGDACPVLPGRRYLDWDLPDPMGADLDTVRSIRDNIDRRVRALLELVPSNGATAH